MKTIFTFLTFLGLSLSIQAQTADEIIANYHEVIGGADAIASMKNMKTTGVARQGGMEFPFTAITTADGKSKVDITFQGETVTVECFDGKEGWAQNFMTKAAEKWTQEDSDIRSANVDFPDPFLNYKEKGYTVTLEGEEEVDGTQCHKIKLVQNPVMVAGEEQEVISFYYFDQESGVPIKSTSFPVSGQMKGMSMDNYMSDYEEVGGVYIPLTNVQKVGGQEVFSMTMQEFETNIEISDDMFAYPE